MHRRKVETNGAATREMRPHILRQVPLPKRWHRRDRRHAPCAKDALLALPTITVTHKPVRAPEEATNAGGKGAEVTRTRKVTFGNLLFPTNYHYVTVEDKFEIRDVGSSTVKREYTKTETKKAYTFGRWVGMRPARSTGRPIGTRSRSSSTRSRAARVLASSFRTRKASRSLARWT
jgi:hypothetical protein